MNLKYTLGAILTVPLLPILYIQGKRIRASVPRLPEASGKEGICSQNPQRKLRIITLGESTIAGIGVATHEEGFTGTLACELARQFETDVHWRVYAHSGYTARRVTQKIIPKITEPDIDLIVIGLGGNDAFTLNTPARWLQHIQALIDAIRKKYEDIPIAFLNMPPIKEFPALTPVVRFAVGNLVEILGEALQVLVADQEAVYYYPLKITLEDWQQRLQLQAERADFFSDGIHPSRLTYQAWAKDFVDNFVMREETLSNYLRKQRNTAKG